MEPLVEQLWQCLHRLKDPFSARDLVATGCVRDIQLTQGVATVLLSPVDPDPHRNEALEQAIRRELGRVSGVESIIVKGITPTNGSPDDAGRGHPARPLPVLDVIGVDGTAEARPLPNMAPEVGYGPDGPPSLSAPEFDPALGERYEGWPPVFQWQVDPRDSSLPSGEAHIELGEWEYNAWWQAHPAGLIYASIQALRDDPAKRTVERQHPLGRNVAVNIVFDQQRQGVVAVYGTARDFRPFIEAFRIGLNLQHPAEGSKS